MPNSYLSLRRSAFEMSKQAVEYDQTLWVVFEVLLLPAKVFQS